MEPADDLRFRVPLYTVAEAARYMRMPQSTYGTWAKGYHRTVRNRSTGAAQVERFAVNLVKIVAACARPGPFIYSVLPTSIERRWP